MRSDALTNAVESIATGSGLSVRHIMTHASATLYTNDPTNVTIAESHRTRNAG